MPANGSGITLADMKFQRAKPILFLSKPIMPNSDITLLASLINHVVFLDVLMHVNVHYVHLFLHIIADNYINNASQIMPRMSYSMLAHGI